MGFCKDFIQHVLICLGGTFLGVAIILFIFGGAFYGLERPKEVNYKKDICLVLTLGYRNRTVQDRVTKYMYNVYFTAWDVRLDTKTSINATVQSEKLYLSIDEALRNTSEHQINTRAVCWFDARQPSIVQWNQPDARTGRILLICGGLSVLIAIYFIVLSIFGFSPDDGLGRYMRPRV